MTTAEKFALVMQINPFITLAGINQNPERVSIVLDNSNPDPITWAIDTDDLEG